MTLYHRDTTSFYDLHQKEYEAERLESAAVKLANPISLRALGPTLLKGNTIADIGAGVDTALGRQIQEKGCRYVAVDQNGSFVNTLRLSGIEAYQGDATNMPIDSNSVDAVHMRFLFGWLNETQRKLVLEQAIRVVKPGQPKTITIIDYDWLKTDGPDEYMKTVEVACGILESFGFDYTYGGKASLSIPKLLDEGALGAGAVYEVGPEDVYRVRKTLGEGLPLLEEAASSLKEHLTTIGDTERIEALDDALRGLRHVDLTAEICLPGIVAETIMVTKRQPSLTRSENRLVRLALSHEHDNYSEDYAPTTIPGVVKVERGSNLDNYMRRVQAAEYLRNGMLVGEEMIDENGMLCEGSYPKKHLDRSNLYVCLPEGAEKPTAGVRLIEPEKTGDDSAQLRSLPTAERMELAMDSCCNGERIFPEDAEPSGVFEVSASIKNSEEGGGLLDMTRAIIGLVAEAKQAGYHTGLMTTQQKMYELVKKVFGEDNFTVLEGPHTSDIHGAADTIKYVCLSVDIRSFLETTQQHTEKGKEGSRTLAEINGILEEYYTR